jgi:hypothetical protein
MPSGPFPTVTVTLAQALEMLDGAPVLLSVALTEKTDVVVRAPVT